jgi:hypothetical protein
MSKLPRAWFGSITAQTRYFSEITQDGAKGVQSPLAGHFTSTT